MLEYGKFATLAALASFCSSPAYRVSVPTSRNASTEPKRQIITSTKRSNITVGTAAKPNMRVTNCTKRGNIVGITVTDGGTSKPTDGARTTTGTTTTGIHDKKSRDDSLDTTRSGMRHSP